ncbi:hypothetical protein [Streptomyces sp. NPDC023838]|uniref:hypothetical protein n=1 Tax=Streptomyces sp. NPDC023838 TaxID=3154325 RepID=UPI003406EFDC
MTTIENCLSSRHVEPEDHVHAGSSRRIELALHRLHGIRDTGHGLSYLSLVTARSVLDGPFGTSLIFGRLRRAVNGSYQPKC